MLWAALTLPCRPDAALPSSDELQGLATWALQFTPRVAMAEEAVVLEVEASARRFGGRRALHERIASEGRELGMTALAWAPYWISDVGCVG